MQLTYNLGQILTEEECDDLALEVIQEQNRGVMRIETDTRYYRNSYGGITTGAWETLKKFTPLIVNTLGREFSNLDNDWPLHVKVNENEVQSFSTPLGHAALMRGGTLPHWRDPLVCRDDQYVIMMFLHWSDPV